MILVPIICRDCLEDHFIVNFTFLGKRLWSSIAYSKPSRLTDCGGAYLDVRGEEMRFLATDRWGEVWEGRVVRRCENGER